LNSEPETLLSPVVVPLALAARRPLVAVLPFGPAGDEAGLRLLGGEIADLLRERLAQDPALQAILISSDFLAKAPPHAVELICRELAIGFLVSGRCHGTGGQPSLYIELTDTRDWHIRWAHFFRGTARSLLASDGEAMQRLVAALREVLVDRRGI
jgi:TolB-like protein